MVTALVFRYVTNHHKLSGFRQRPYFCSQFCKSVVWSDMTGFSAPCLPELKWRYWLGLCFHLEFQGFFQAHGIVAECRSWWLWHGGPCFLAGHQLEATVSFYRPHTFLVMWPPLSSKPAGENFCTSDPSCTLNLCPLPSLTSTPLTFRAHRIKSGPPGKSPYFKVNCFGTLISFAKSHHSSTWISIWLKN